MVKFVVIVATNNRLFEDETFGIQYTLGGVHSIIYRSHPCEGEQRSTHSFSQRLR